MANKPYIISTSMRKYDLKDDYKTYRETQINRSISKWDATTFDFCLFGKVLLTAYCLMVIKGGTKLLRPREICCLGIRNGNEYFAFKNFQKAIIELEKAKIVGIDINPKVKEVGENCFCEDFNKLPVDWNSRFDLVYSNSLDHSNDVSKTIDEWYRVTRNDRYILLTLSTGSKVCSTDIYDFDREDCIKLFDSKRFEIKKIWKENEQVGSFNVLVRTIK